MKSMATPADLKLATMIAGIAIVLVAGIALGSLVRRFRQPTVVGEILAGIMLGPSVLGQLPGNLPKHLFPHEVLPLLSAVAQVGLLLFMFIVGWEFERQLVRGHQGLAAAVSFASVALSFVLGLALAVWLYPHHSNVAGHHISFMAFGMFMGAAMSVTAFPVLARILTDNALTHTRVGVLALASAAVDDLLAWCMLAYVSALVAAHNTSGLVQVAVLSALYVVAMFAVVRPALAVLVSRWSKQERWQALLVLFCSGTFVSSWITTWIGIHAIFGAFLFGIITPREPARALAEQVRKPLDNIVLILMPVFFIITGLGVNIGGLSGRQYVELAFIIGVACAGKLLGAIVPARMFRLPWRESRALGLLMNTRGLTGLIILNAAMNLGVLDGQMFTMMVIMALFTTALAGPLLPRARELDAPTVAPVAELSGSPS